MGKTVKLELQDGILPEDLAQECTGWDGEGCIWDVIIFKCPFGPKPCHAVTAEDWEKVMEDEDN